MSCSSGWVEALLADLAGAASTHCTQLLCSALLCCLLLQAEVNRSQRMEGSFINKSLLTLGTVIHKLRRVAATVVECTCLPACWRQQNVLCMASASNVALLGPGLG